MTQRYRTLKTKLLLSVLPAVTVLAVITVLVLTTYFRWSTQTTVEKQQFTLATLMASKLDDQFDSYRKVIVSLAKAVPAGSLNNPAALEHFPSGALLIPPANQGRNQ